MRTIVLKGESGLRVLVDDEDYPLLSRHSWYAMRVRDTEKVYAQTRFGKDEKITLLMHTMVMGNPPAGQVVDHINDDGLDNRKSNLRFLLNAENIRRHYRDNPNVGIKLMPAKISNPYKVSVSLGGKAKHVGYFPSVETARRARNQAIEKYLATGEL